MFLDGHIHIREGKQDKDEFQRRLEQIGIHGGLIISHPPRVFHRVARPRSARERLDNLLFWTSSNPNLFPFFWIDPLEDNVIEQINMALESNVSGFKVICNRYYPGDRRPLEVFCRIANNNKPVLFHSGILWDGEDSSRYNCPRGFEALLEVDGLRFCLAHLAWPWHDELVAVYGKFLNAQTYRPELSVEMFIDISPGTPPVYRREALTKLFRVGYKVDDNVIFGSDSSAIDYDTQWVQEWIGRDEAIYDALDLDLGVREKLYGLNLLRFLGKTCPPKERNERMERDSGTSQKE